MNNQKVKWGVIGAGGIADRRTIPGMMLAESCKLTAVMEVNEEASNSLAKKYNAPYHYTAASELLANPEIEAVYIASPVVFHKEQVIAAAKSHKHILCEKPIAINLEDSEEVNRICADCGVLAAAGFMMRYHSLHRAMKRIISDGDIGQTVSCRLQMSCWFPYIEGNWRQQFKNTGGGALMDMGIHCIDLAEYILGSQTKAVSAFCGTNTFNYDIEDSSNIMLKTDNGTIVYIDNNYNIPDDAAMSRIEVYGTKGSLIAENTIGQAEAGVLRCIYSNQETYSAIQDRGSINRKTIEPESGNLYTKELESFSHSILSGIAEEIPLAAAIRAQRIIKAAYRSSNSGIVSILE